MYRYFSIILFAFVLGGCAANAQKRFSDLDCDLVDISAELPNACAAAFSVDPSEPVSEDSLYERGSTELFAAELQISLAAINHYSVILAEGERGWELSAFVGRVDEPFGANGVYGRTYRSVHFEVPEARVDAFKLTLEERGLLRLETPTEPMTRTNSYGETVHIVCLDGASLFAKQFSNDYVGSASRHHCRGRTAIDDFADALFDLAVEFDPELEAYRFTIAKDGD